MKCESSPWINLAVSPLGKALLQIGQVETKLAIVSRLNELPHLLLDVLRVGHGTASSLSEPADGLELRSPGLFAGSCPAEAGNAPGTLETRPETPSAKTGMGRHGQRLSLTALN
jgi:hypothetical protein